MDLIEYHKRLGGKVIKRFKLPADETQAVDRLLAEKHRPQIHGNAKPVFIVGGVNESRYQERIQQNGALPLPSERSFPSSMVASKHFGYTTDQVGYALREAKLKGDDIAEVAGVPLQRVADIND